MMIMKGGGEGTPEGGAGAGRRSSAGPRWAADFQRGFRCFWEYIRTADARTGGALPTFENLGRFLRHGSDAMSEAAEGD
jgi:hypothetical protein